MESITFEEYFWKRYGFILPDKHSIENIKEFADETILEIGSGTGLYAKLLQNNGVNVIATDNLEGNYKEWYEKTWVDIEKIDAVEAVKKYKDINSLMIVWPGNEQVWVDAVNNFKGNKLIYVGDSGPKELHEMIESEWKLFGKQTMNTFPTTNHAIPFDTPTLYLLKRKEKE